MAANCPAPAAGGFCESDGLCGGGKICALTGSPALWLALMAIDLVACATRV
jgi:hypothetical protein